MIYSEYQTAGFLKFSHLAKQTGICHFVTTRRGGYSSGEYGGLNLSFSVGDEPENVAKNRRMTAEASGTKAENFVFQNQQHGNHVRIVGQKDRRDFSKHTYSFTDSDALITQETGLCLFVFAADCVPILLYDPVRKAAGAIHSGRKGTTKRIVQHSIKKMQNAFGSRPGDLLVGIGPAISADNYEIGSQAALEFTSEFGNEAKQFIHTPSGKKEHLDLYAANLFLVRETGVPDAQIEMAPYCTFENEDLFFSARRQKIGGRFGAGIMLNTQ